MLKATEGTAQYECQNCGAKLPAPDDRGVRTCTYCGAVFHSPTPPGAGAGSATGSEGFTIIVNAPGMATTPVDYSGIAEAGVKASKVGCFITLVITVAILAGVGIPIYLAVRDSGGLKNFGIDIPGQNYDVSESSIAALPAGEPSAPLGFVALVSRYENGAVRWRIAKVDGSSGKEQWVSADLPEGTTRVGILADTNNAYVATGRQVRALKLSDGSAEWQGSLTDEFQGVCTNCFWLVGERLIVRSNDGVIQAFDTASGRAVWSRRLAQVSNQAFLAGPHLFIIDGAAGKQVPVVVNPADGVELRQVPVTCQRPGSSFVEHLDTSSAVLPAPADGSVIVGYGSSPACWQRWDLNTGQKMWELQVAGASLSIADDATAVYTPTSVVVGAGGEVTEFDLATGQVRTAIKDTETEFRPIAATGTMILVEAKSTRGTTKVALRGYQSGGAAQGWEFNLGDAESVPPEGESSVTSGDNAFGAALMGGKLRIVTFSGDTKSLELNSVDPETGIAAASTTIELKLDALIPGFRIVTWRGDKVLLVAGDDAFVLDVATNNIVFRYPG
jgi:outer membrane protein assembly factor BamB